MAPIRAAVLGVGFSAKVFQIPFILALPEVYQLHTILERRATPEKSIARDKYGHLGVKVVNTLDDVLGDPEVDLVVVAVKDSAHYDYAKAALSAGKHVILEKPVTATSAEMRELIEIAKDKKLVLAPYHNRRFDGDFRTVQSLIQSGKVSELVDFESRFDLRADWPLGPPGGSAGITFGLGSHLIDQAIALFGAPKSVTALLENGRREGHLDVDDSFIIHMRYADSPVLVTLRSALHSVLSHQIRFIVRGRETSFVKFGLDVQEPQIQEGLSPLDPGFGEDPEENWGEFGRRDPDGTMHFLKIKTLPGSYKDYYNNVADAINGIRTLEVTPEHAELGIRIIEAAKKSAVEKRTVDL
ncbi:oxidoreductase NAD-binding protein [Punctularia strigosozonata HHB-11173 SS5]|uniref:oxidoreductase NAD-binding protein n=1 Tax=Punctularia strigosozonata (strain HHB-11173) TaxID=741275 RepID=UPI0004416841|nr:oxidoreductase NAD-binding protein [Punctularia strigosozonata HHB-11173 SS5]EIN08044.1 oxidoreductase NAD-binding protein [Punctularia strigosozonata HHB-11173 SS5]